MLVAVSWWTAEKGHLDYHRYSGYIILGLLAFRIFWGFAGSSTARFANFLRTPRVIRDYAQRLAQRERPTAPATPGHNPLGALSVVALLAALLTQVLLGLFAVDIDGIESGPLSAWVSFDTGRAAAGFHHKLFDALLALIGLHVAAVLFYLLYRRENLLAAMLTGRRSFPYGVAVPVTFAPVTRLVVGIVLASALVWAVARAFQF